jgi:glycosyltransferase involved in cell wall biosynthesis
MDHEEGFIDILMITYNRDYYTKLALQRLFETCDPKVRVWIWHNGGCKKTLEVVREYLSHENLYRFFHSEENLKLTEPTNWLWANGKGTYVAKVDDDSLLPSGWASKLREAHQKNPRFGAIGCWRFFPEDFNEPLAAKKIRNYNGISLMQHPWMEGSGYVMKRACIEQAGLLQENETFPSYCRRLAWLGWIHGWYFPFLYQEHMDDPRSVHFMYKSDEDFHAHRPLTAVRNGVETIDQWKLLFAATAKHVLKSSIYPGRFFKSRSLLKRLSYWMSGPSENKRGS